MAIENYATAGAKARTWNRLATLLAKFFASKNIRYAYHRLAEYPDNVQLSKAISAPHIDSYYISISFKKIKEYEKKDKKKEEKKQERKKK